jgi:hypothetical protein
MAPYRRYRRPLPSTRALTAKIVVLAVAAAVAIGALISVEMAGGNDPALGQKAARVKHASSSSSSSSSSSGSSAGSGGYSYYGNGSSGYSSGSGGYSSSAPPVTSSTS